MTALRRGVELTIPHRALAKGRPRMGRNGSVYTPKTTKDYEAKVAQAWRDSGHATFEGNVSVVAEFYGDETRVKIAELNDGDPFLRGDTDNYLKSLLDGLQGEGLAFPDDRTVLHVAGTRMVRVDP